MERPGIEIPGVSHLFALKWQLFSSQCDTYIIGSTDVSEHSSSYFLCRLMMASDCRIDFQYLNFHRCDLNGTNCRPVFQYTHANRTNLLIEYEDYSLRSRWAAYEYLFYEHELYINPILVDDEGVWFCSVTVGGQIYHSLSEVSRLVHVKPDTNDIRISHDKAFIVATFPTEFICLVPRVRPLINITWMVNNVAHRDDNPNVSSNGQAFTVQSRILLMLEFIHSHSITCRLERNQGQTWVESHPLSIQQILPPPVAEYPPRVTTMRVTIHGELTLRCVFSGTSLIIWKKDSQDIPSELFHSPNLTLIRGVFAYNQTDAWISEITWRKPSVNAKCNELEKYSGNYYCLGLVDEYPEYEKKSLPTIVRIGYKPQNIHAGDLQINTTVGQQVVITCPMCASPHVHEYQWTHNGQPIRNGITGSAGDKLLINHVQKKDFGVYRCRATNTHGYVIVETSLNIYVEDDTEEEVTEDSQRVSAGIIAGFIILSLALLVFILTTITGAIMYQRLKGHTQHETEYLDNSTTENKSMTDIYENAPRRDTKVSKEEHIECDTVSVETGSFDNLSTSVTTEDNTYQQLEIPRRGHINEGYNHYDSVGNTES